MADRSATRTAVADDLARLEAGMDALQTASSVRRRSVRRVLVAVLSPVVALAVLVLGWQVAVWLEVRPSYLLPSPAEVAGTLAEAVRDGSIAEGVTRSLGRAAIGFAASVAIATPLGLLVARVGAVRASLKPLLSGLQTLPSVAWVPAAIIWFGLTDATIYTVVLLGAVPSIANGMVAGVEQIPPIYQRVGRVLGARGLATARFILLPAALPGYLAGLRQGWAFAWRSLMAAELISASPALGSGLGQQLEIARTLSDLPGVLGLILVILVVGILVESLLFAPLERGVLRRRGLLTA